MTSRHVKGTRDGRVVVSGEGERGHARGCGEERNARRAVVIDEEGTVGGHEEATGGGHGEERNDHEEEIDGKGTGGGCAGVNGGEGRGHAGENVQGASDHEEGTGDHVVVSGEEETDPCEAGSGAVGRESGGVGNGSDAVGKGSGQPWAGSDGVEIAEETCADVAPGPEGESVQGEGEEAMRDQTVDSDAYTLQKLVVSPQAVHHRHPPAECDMASVGEAASAWWQLQGPQEPQRRAVAHTQPASHTAIQEGAKMRRFVAMARAGGRVGVRTQAPSGMGTPEVQLEVVMSRFEARGRGGERGRGEISPPQLTGPTLTPGAHTLWGRRRNDGASSAQSVGEKGVGGARAGEGHGDVGDWLGKTQQRGRKLRLRATLPQPSQSPINHNNVQGTHPLELVHGPLPLPRTRRGDEVDDVRLPQLGDAARAA